MTLRELFLHAQAGDKEAFGEVYHRQYASIQRGIAHHLRAAGIEPSFDQLEDFCATVFVRALAALPNLQVGNKGQLRYWLQKLAINVVKDYLKSPHVSREVLVAEVPDRVDWLAEEAFAAIDYRLQAPELRELLKSLTPEQRAAIEHFVLLEEPDKRLAEVEGSYPTAIKQRRQRAMKALRRGDTTRLTL